MAEHTGDYSTCRFCGNEITFDGMFWKHTEGHGWKHVAAPLAVRPPTDYQSLIVAIERGHILVITPDCDPDRVREELQRMFGGAAWWRDFLQGLTGG